MTEELILPQNVRAFVEFHVMADTEDDAEDFFVIAKERLLCAPKWNALAHADSPKIILANSKGESLTRNARQSDYLKLATELEEQWFKITAISYDDYPDENAESMTISIAEVEGPVQKDELAPDPQYFLVTGRKDLRLTAHFFHYCFKSQVTELDHFPWLQWVQAILDFS